MCKFVRSNYSLFEINIHAQPMRKIVQKPLVVPQNRLKLCRKNCYSMAISVYNKLPQRFREMPEPEFSKNIFNWLCEKCFYTINEYLIMKF